MRDKIKNHKNFNKRAMKKNRKYKDLIENITYTNLN